MINLNLPTAGVETKFPSLAIGEYKCSIGECTVHESGKTQGLHMIRVELKLEEPASSSDGRAIPPGFKFNTNYTLPLPDGHSDYKPDSDKLPDGIRMRSICAFMDAALGTTKETRPALTTELLPTFAGKVVKVKIKARKNTDDGYGDTEVQSITAA